MTEPVLNTIFERTQFSDEAYGSLGRALSFAAEYESNCRALAVILGLKMADKEANRLLSDDERGQLVDLLWKRRLSDHIKDVIGKHKTLPDDMRDFLTKARLSRNTIVHDLSNELRGVFETGEGRSQLLKQLGKQTAILAKANFLIGFLLAIATNEPPPRIEYLNKYVQHAVLWVTEVEI